jgi:hypothetical protein
MAAPLFELLLADLPSGFCSGLVARMQFVYLESFESVKNDPRFGEPEMRYMHGHTRRALVEFGLRELAAEHGLGVEMKRADGVGGPEHVMLTSGRFCFTACHISTINSFPKESRHREQYSVINEHVAQGQLFPIASLPTAADIYGIIFHCEAGGSKSKLGTLSIGFPNERCDDWIDAPIPLVDLADAQEHIRNAPDATQAAAPKWKKGKTSDRKTN